MKKKHSFHQERAFTLIEVLLASLIMGVVGFILSDILSRSFKSNDKVQLTSNIKQSGQTALNIISETVRDSDKIICPLSASTPFKVIVLKKYDTDKTKNVFTRFRICAQSDPSNCAGGNNGFISIDSPPVDQNNEIALTNLCLPDYQSPNASKLIDNDLNTGVSIVDGKFEYSSFDPTNRLVLVRLDIGPSIQSRSGYENQIPGGFITFQTTVQKR